MIVTALILTAGRSRRMGRPKAWLRLAGKSLVERVCESALDGGADALVVVAGSDADPRLACRSELEPRLSPLAAARSKPLTVVLGCPDGHPIDSIRAGIRVLQGSALLLWPVDHPFADAALVRRLIDELGDASNIVVPTCSDRHAHPVLFSPAVVPELESAIADSGAHRVVSRDPSRVVEVPVNDPRLLGDLNTPEEAAALGVELA